MIIEFEGQRYDVPDGTTPAEMEGLLKGPGAASPGAARAPTRKRYVEDDLVGIGEKGLNLLSQAVAWPLALGAGAGEEASPWKRDDNSITMPPPGHPAAPRYGKPPAGPDGKPLPFDAMTPEQQRAERDAWERENGLIRSRDARERGNVVEQDVTAALTYRPYTEGGQRVSAAFDSAAANTLGRPLRWVDRNAGNVAAGIAERLGAEEPEQEAARATVGEIAQLATGGAIAKAVPVLGKKARVAADAASSRLRQAAINQGRKVLTGNAASTLTTKVPLSPKAIEAAYDAGAIRAFGTVQRAEEVLWALREKLGNDYGALLTELEARGVRGPNAVKLALELSNDASKVAKMTAESVNPTARLLREAAEKDILSKADPRPFADKTLSLTQAEAIKRDYQTASRDAYKRPGETLMGGAQKLRASRMREAIEEAVDDQAAKAPDLAAKFVPLKQKLGPVIEASDATINAVARAANRQDFGLTSKIAGLMGFAGGGPGGGLAALLGARALRNRGPATFGSTARALSKLLEKPAPPGVTQGARLLSLLEALRAQQAKVPPGPSFQFQFPVGVPAAVGEER